MPKIRRRRKTWLAIGKYTLAMATAIAILMLLLRLSGLPEAVAFYHPMPLRGEKPAGAEDVYFTTEDGLRLHGWFIRATTLIAGERGPVVLHSHGNAGSVAGHSGATEFLPASGISVLTFDYRSFGRSQQSSRPLGRDALARDTHAAYEYLLTRADVDPDRIGTIGISLGGAFASSLTANVPQIRACCLVSAFSGWQEVAFDHAKTLGRNLIGAGLDPIDSVRAIGKRPVMVVHGDRDSVVPYRHGKQLVQAAQEAGNEAVFERVQGASHNNVLSTSPTTKPAIVKFFVDALRKRDNK